VSEFLECLIDRRFGSLEIAKPHLEHLCGRTLDNGHVLTISSFFLVYVK
jgi:hypothetical protein